MNCNRALLSLLVFLSSLISSGSIPCSPFFKDGDPTICFLLQVYEDKESEYARLIGEGKGKLENVVFPSRKDFYTSLVEYDGTLQPIPIGPTVYFLVFATLLLVWYFTAISRHYFQQTKSKLLLHPETAKFPNLPLYWLQQSKREILLKREVRNTWAWLAKRYLLSPDDPLLDGIDEVMGLTTWEDFHVPRDTWSLLNVILKINQLYLKIRKTPAGRASFRILKDPTGSYHPLQSVKHALPESFHDEDENAEEGVESHFGVLLFAPSSFKRPTIIPSVKSPPKRSPRPKSPVATASNASWSSSDEKSSATKSSRHPVSEMKSKPIPHKFEYIPTSTPQHGVPKKRVSIDERPGPKHESRQADLQQRKREARKSILKKKRHFKSKQKQDKGHGQVFGRDEQFLEEYEPDYFPSELATNGSKARLSTRNGKDEILSRYLKGHGSGHPEEREHGKKGKKVHEEHYEETYEIKHRNRPETDRKAHRRHHHHHHKKKRISDEEGDQRHKSSVTSEEEGSRRPHRHKKSGKHARHHHHHHRHSHKHRGDSTSTHTEFMDGQRSSRLEYPSSSEFSHSSATHE